MGESPDWTDSPLGFGWMKSPSNRQRLERIGLSASRKGRSGPLPRAHFRVFLDRREVGIERISPLHWAGEEHPEIRQSVVLRRAVSTDRTLYAWWAAVARGKSDTRSVVIAQLLSPDGKPINIWRLEKAVPIRWTGPGLDALSGEIAYEELELQYQSISWRARV